MVDGLGLMFQMEEKSQILRVEDMPVFRLAYELLRRLEKASRSFPREFHWLRSQLLRAAESVPANLTEGCYAQYSTEYLQSLFRCRREGREALLHLRFAADTGLIGPDVRETLVSEYEGCLHQLNHVIRSIESKIANRGKQRPPNLREDHADYAVSFAHSEPSTINP